MSSRGGPGGGVVSVAGYYAGRVAVITGAGSGIGRALALALAAAGARVAVADRDGDAAEAVARQCQGAGTVRADAVDVADRQAVLDYAAAMGAEAGGVDLMFAVAGVIHSGTLVASEFADLDRVIEVNLLGTMNTAKAFLPALTASGRGHLVTFSSGFGLMAAPHYTAYSASKFAIRGFSEALRQELARGSSPVTVSCVYPGRIRTAIMRNGSYAAGENAAAIVAGFDKAARLDAGQAAGIILRGVARRRSQVLVGADVRIASLLLRLAGSRYPDVFPMLARRRRKSS